MAKTLLTKVINTDHLPASLYEFYENVDGYVWRSPEDFEHPAKVKTVISIEHVKEFTQEEIDKIHEHYSLDPCYAIDNSAELNILTAVATEEMWNVLMDWASLEPDAYELPEADDGTD